MAGKLRVGTKIIAPSKEVAGRTILSCAVCGTRFSLPNCHARRKGVGKYCSTECQNKDREKTKEKRKRVCQSCGKIFYPRWSQINSGQGKYCSQKCNFESNKTKLIDLSEEQQQKRLKNWHASMAGKYRIGERNCNWKGGRSISYQGYVLLNRGDGNGQRQEHRLFASETVKRELDVSEFVHHINSIKTDNRLSNLQIVPGGIHTSVHAAHRKLNIKSNIVIIAGCPILG